MTPYAIQGPARHCSASGRELKPGERFYSALLDEDGRFVRKDYAADAWAGSPPGAFAHWAGRIPDNGQPKRPTINDEVLVDCFDHLAPACEPAQRNFRYVLALLLMRRKRFKFEDARRLDGQELLCVRDVRDGVLHEVPDPRLTEDEVRAVQDEVFRLLGWN
jgi:hypothetical protein